MKFTSALAIFALFWTISLFLVLPFGVRTAEEAGVKHQPGHAESAPHTFSLGRVAARATILGAILFGLYYLNYINGWITADALDWVR